jgi:tetratricopeptide (TPR) repeat protein
MKKPLGIASVVGAFLLVVLGAYETVRLYRARLAYRTARHLYETSGRNPGEPAVRALTRSVNLACGDPDPHFLLGRIAARERRHEDALLHMKDAARANPLDGRTHYYVGRAFHDLGRVDEAAVSMETAARLSRNNPEHLWSIGYYFWHRWESESRSKVSDFRKAFGILKKAVGHFRVASEGDIAYLSRALSLFQKYALPYENLVDVIPDTPEAHHRAGRYFGHDRGLWTPALTEFQKVGTAFEERWDFLFDRGLARLFRTVEPRPDPVPDLRRAVELAPDRNGTILRLARYFTFARRLETGLALWIELEQTYPGLPGPAVNRAETELERVRQSLKDDIASIGEERNRALARARSPRERREIQDHFAGKGRALWCTSLRHLETYLQDRLAAFPRSGKLWRLKAQVLLQCQKLDEAEVDFKHAAEFGNEAAMWKGYVRFLINRTKHKEAWQTAIQARTHFPEDKDLIRLRDDALQKMLREQGKGK